MRIQVISAIAAMAIGLGMAPALAQSGPHIGSCPTAVEQEQLMNEPGYVVGISAAYVGDGSDPDYTKTQQQLANEPGYSVGTGAAHVGDGSDPVYAKTQQQLANEPGYSVGTGAAQTRGR